MTTVITVPNVNHAVSEALWKIKFSGVHESSRNGDVLVFPTPVMTCYQQPMERVLFWPERDANPFFHLMEAIWMMAGRDDVKFVEYFNSRMRGFSDDGEVLNGAYGHRWRKRFGVDQVVALVEHLIDKPNSRRAVLTMWGVDEDLLLIDDSKDVCCNTGAYFMSRNGILDITVLNRSNDMIWGAYGANAVHFSILHEFVARASGQRVGNYYQFSNNLHLYVDLYDSKKYLDTPPDPHEYDEYEWGNAAPLPLLADGEDWRGWLQDCQNFCEAPFELQDYRCAFFSTVAYPMAKAYQARKEYKEEGYDWARRIAASDWRLAALQWIDRREK